MAWTARLNVDDFQCKMIIPELKSHIELIQRRALEDMLDVQRDKIFTRILIFELDYNSVDKERKVADYNYAYAQPSMRF